MNSTLNDDQESIILDDYNDGEIFWGAITESERFIMKYKDQIGANKLVIEISDDSDTGESLPQMNPISNVNRLIDKKMNNVDVDVDEVKLIKLDEDNDNKDDNKDKDKDDDDDDDGFKIRRRSFNEKHKILLNKFRTTNNRRKSIDRHMRKFCSNQQHRPLRSSLNNDDNVDDEQCLNNINENKNNNDNDKNKINEKDDFDINEISIIQLCNDDNDNDNSIKRKIRKSIRTPFHIKSFGHGGYGGHGGQAGRHRIVRTRTRISIRSMTKIPPTPKWKIDHISSTPMVQKDH